MNAHTRFAELGYEKQCDLWRIVDNATGAAIGPFYRSKAELLADLERYATDYGCANASPRDPVRAAAPDLLEECRAHDTALHMLYERLLTEGKKTEAAEIWAMIQNNRALILRANGKGQPHE